MIVCLKCGNEYDLHDPCANACRDCCPKCGWRPGGCPKCGGEMYDEFVPTSFDRDHQYGYYTGKRLCKCGHEEKVK